MGILINAELLAIRDVIKVDGREMTVTEIKPSNGVLSVSGFVTGVGHNFFFCLPTEGIELLKGA